LRALQSVSVSQYNPPAMSDTVGISRTFGRWGLFLGTLVFITGLILAVQVPDAQAQRKRVVFGEESAGSEVVGYVHKPEVGYVITRQEQEDLETLQLKESFLPKIVKSVEKKPF